MLGMLAAALALVLSLCTSGIEGQTVSELGAVWIPTDLNYALISNLRKDPLQDPASKISGYSTLGVIPVNVVASWMNALNSNPSLREGTVRWVPTVASKCTSGVVGCTKSVHITVLEFTYVNISATDCKAYALVGADAVLPQQAVLTDGNNTYQPTGPVNYEITASPNSTASNCTYVVQYPKATQTLANQLCDQSCFNSPCQPCNANQTLAGSDIATNCTAASGISPSLVAAIQGAGQCLAAGQLGRFQCQVAFSSNTSACSQMSCFPGDASVLVEGRGRRLMRELSIGDRVQVAKPDGTLAFDDIYFFGHRVRHALGSYIRLTLLPRLSHENRHKVIEISGKHFLPASSSRSNSQAWTSAKPCRAEDILLGDTVWAAGSHGLEAFQVVAKAAVSREGLWAPYTATGTIIVDGVAASVHSDWYLDSLLEAVGRPDLLPAVYQVMLAPIRLLYWLLGSRWMQEVDARYDLGALISSPLTALSTSMMSCSFAAAAVAAAASLCIKLRS